LKKKKSLQRLGSSSPAEIPGFRSRTTTTRSGRGESKKEKRQKRLLHNFQRKILKTERVIFRRSKISSQAGLPPQDGRKTAEKQGEEPERRLRSDLLIAKKKDSESPTERQRCVTILGGMSERLQWGCHVTWEGRIEKGELTGVETGRGESGNYRITLRLSSKQERKNLEYLPNQIVRLCRQTRSYPPGGERRRLKGERSKKKNSKEMSSENSNETNRDVPLAQDGTKTRKSYLSKGRPGTNTGREKDGNAGRESLTKNQTRLKKRQTKMAVVTPKYGRGGETTGGKRTAPQDIRRRDNSSWLGRHAAL